MEDNKIVFDIETKNLFVDVGGKKHIDKLDVSVVAVYSYNDDEYKVFDEYEMDKLGKILQKADPLIGFSSKQFDVPVLEKYFNFKLSAVPHFDIFEKIYHKLERRIGLDPLAEANIDETKTHHGIEAPKMYERGEMDELKAYCLQDVKVTKKIFDLILSKGYLWVPKKGLPNMDKVEITYSKPDKPQNSLI